MSNLATAGGPQSTSGDNTNLPPIESLQEELKAYKQFKKKNDDGSEEYVIFLSHQRLTFCPRNGIKPGNIISESLLAKSGNVPN